jgi:hypothetical protein
MESDAKRDRERRQMAAYRLAAEHQKGNSGLEFRKNTTAAAQNIW